MNVLFEKIFAILTLGFSDTKYLKIRIEVLKSLKKMLLGVNKKNLEMKHLNYFHPKIKIQKIILSVKNMMNLITLIRNFEHILAS